MLGRKGAETGDQADICLLNGVIVDWPPPQAGCRRPPRRLRRSAGGCPMREGQREAPPHATWRGCPRCLRSANTHEKARAPATRATVSPHPFKKRKKHRRSLRRPVAPIAGCFDRSSVPSSVSWWPPTPRPGPPQVADLTTRRCPRQPKAATTRHCLVPVLCRSAKTSFPEARTTSLRSVVLSA